MELPDEAVWALKPEVVIEQLGKDREEDGEPDDVEEDGQEDDSQDGVR